MTKNISLLVFKHRSQHKPPLVLSLLLLLFGMATLGAQSAIKTSDLPLLAQLQRGDPGFDQLSTDIGLYYQARAKKQEGPAMLLYRYLVKKSETLFTISARLNLPHSTLATLNRLSGPQAVKEGLELIIPNLPGIYLAQQPQTQLEDALSRRLMAFSSSVPGLRFSNADGLQIFSYFPSEDFSPEERLLFLGTIFRPPLASYRVSSNFGMRKNPVSGNYVRHEGVDLVAPIGTAVLAAADGVVSDTGFDSIYGNYIIIDHRNSHHSVYAHLQKTSVRKGQTVRAGQSIGALGNSGQSTGAHLHFEIQVNGVPRDPLVYIKK